MACFALVGLGKKRSRLVRFADADIGFQGKILLLCEPIKAGKVGRTAIDAALAAVFLDVAHLPWAQTQAQQGGTIGRIRVECE